MADNPLRAKEIALTGKLITSVDPATIDVNFQELKNLRYTNTGLRAVSGMSKINSTAITTYTNIKSGFHFNKVEPAESHIIVQAYNSGETASQVHQNTTAIPGTGDFDGTALHTDGSGAGIGHFSDAPGGAMAYCNGVESMIWGGDEHFCSGFIVYDSGGTAEYDYSSIINNTLTDSSNIATMKHTTHYVGSIQPLTKIKYYVETVNTSTGTFSAKYWNGSAWVSLTVSSDGTAAGGVPLAQTGTVVFNDTITSTKVKDINGVIIYWYEITITNLDDTTTVSKAAVSFPFQAIKDIWSGETNLSLSYQIFKNSTYNDNTINVAAEDFNSVNTATFSQVGSLTYGAIANPVFAGAGLDDAASGGTYTGGAAATFTLEIDATGTPDTFKWKKDAGSYTTGVSITGSAQNLSDGVTVMFNATTGHTLTDVWTIAATVEVNFLVAGFGDRQMGLDIVIVGEAVNTATATPTIYYWNGDGWTSVGTLSDGTLEGSATFAKSGFITWDTPSFENEFQTKLVKGVTLYYYKIAFNANLSADVKIDLLKGIPAQKEIQAYKFPISAHNRVFLCSNQNKGKNSVLPSATNSANVFNGEDTVTLSFGNDGEITAGVGLFRQYGSSLFNLTVFTKNNETWILVGNGPEDWVQYKASGNIGCPAQGTMVVANVGFESVPTQNRYVAIWQGLEGIYLFDGTVIREISDDISDLFDKRLSTSINTSMISKSVAFFDNQEQEYHWLFASGASTSLNKEMVYDLSKQRWYEIDRGTGEQLQMGLSVTDTNGNRYNYGGENDGFIYRLENGNQFEDNDIVSNFRFGDMALGGREGGSIATLTRLRKIKLITTAKASTNNSVTVTYRGDGITTGTALTEMSPNKNGYRTTQIVNGTNKGNFIFHDLNFSMTTSNESIPFEPLFVGLLYTEEGLDLN